MLVDSLRSPLVDVGPPDHLRSDRVHHGYRVGRGGPGSSPSCDRDQRLIGGIFLYPVHPFQRLSDIRSTYRPARGTAPSTPRGISRICSATIVPRSPPEMLASSPSGGKHTGDRGGSPACGVRRGNNRYNGQPFNSAMISIRSSRRRLDHRGSKWRGYRYRWGSDSPVGYRLH